MSNSLPPQVLHDLTILYLKQHPEKLVGPPDAYPGQYVQTYNQIKAINLVVPLDEKHTL